MKLKKVIAIALSVAMVTSVASMATGCKKEAIVNDGKTVNVRLYKAGYGDEYMTAWANAFSTLYAEEGYKINVVEATTTIQGVNVTNELTMKEKNRIDLYLAGQISNGSIASVSNTEGFSYSLVEAISTGTPVIIRNSFPAAKFLTSQHNGFLFAKDATNEELSELLKKIMHLSFKQYDELVHNNFQFALTKLSTETFDQN